MAKSVKIDNINLSEITSSAEEKSDMPEEDDYL